MAMSKFDKLYDAIETGKTILCVGPMSKHCINSAKSFTPSKWEMFLTNKNGGTLWSSRAVLLLERFSHMAGSFSMSRHDECA